jgi:signal transduction histidine kinase
VSLLATAGEGKVVFTVENDGGGVPAEEVERIFDIYVTKKEGEAQGVGLGLPLSRRLARLLGGELRAVSLPDRGRFILELPASPEP